MVVKRLLLVFQMPKAGPPGQTASLSLRNASVGYEKGTKTGRRSPKTNVQMLVGARCPAAVKALSIAILMEVIFAPSMRWKAMRWQAESTTAMSDFTFKID